MNAQIQTQSTIFVPFKRKNSHELYVKKLSNLNSIIIKGWSLTPDIRDQYEDILYFIDLHFAMSDELNLFFKYELFNTVSGGFIFRIIKKLNHYNADGKKVNLHWMCGETTHDMLDAGIDFKKFSEFRFLIELS